MFSLENLGAPYSRLGTRAVSKLLAKYLFRQLGLIIYKLIQSGKYVYTQWFLRKKFPLQNAIQICIIYFTRIIFCFSLLLWSLMSLRNIRGFQGMLPFYILWHYYSWIPYEALVKIATRKLAWCGYTREISTIHRHKANRWNMALDCYF